MALLALVLATTMSPNDARRTQLEFKKYRYNKKSREVSECE